MRGLSGTHPTSWRGYGSASTRRAPWATASRRPVWRCPSGSVSWAVYCSRSPTGTSPCPPELPSPVSTPGPVRLSPQAPPRGSSSLSGSGRYRRRRLPGEGSAHPILPPTNSCRRSVPGRFDLPLPSHGYDDHPAGLVRKRVPRQGAEEILHPHPGLAEHHPELIHRVHPHVEGGRNPDPVLSGQHVLRHRTHGAAIEPDRHPKCSRRDLDRLVPVPETRQPLPGVPQIEEQDAPLLQAHAHVVQNPLVLPVVEEPEGGEKGEAQVERAGAAKHPHVLPQPFHGDPLPERPRARDAQHLVGKVDAGHHVPPPGERDGVPSPPAPPAFPVSPYPFTTATGLSLATFLAIPASCTTATTSDTSL